MSSLPFGNVPPNYVRSSIEALRDGIMVDIARTAMTIEEAIIEARKLSDKFDNIIVRNPTGSKVWSLR